MTTPTIRKGPSGPLAEFDLTSDDIQNLSIVEGDDVTTALNTLAARAPHYLDDEDDPIGLWQFNNTLNSVVGPNFSLAAGTSLGFTEIIPGFKAVTAGTGVRLDAAANAALRLTGDMSIELQIMLEDLDAGQVVVSMAGAGAGSANNKLYEMSNPQAVYPRNMAFNWENGVQAAQSFATPTAAGSASVPPIHVISIWGWSRIGNVLTPYMNGNQFSAASAVQPAPTGGSSSILSLYASSRGGAVNISFSAIASLAIYNYGKTAAQFKASYNRALGDFWGILS